MGQKLGPYPISGCALFSGVSWIPIEHKVAWAEAYLHIKWHLSLSSRLATTDIGQKLGLCPFRGGELVPIYHSVAQAEAYLRTNWHLDPCSRLATIHVGHKLGGSAHF